MYIENVHKKRDSILLFNKMNNIFRKIIDCFQENIVVTVLANLAPLLFQKCARACFSYALPNRCQIASDSCKNNAREFI